MKKFLIILGITLLFIFGCKEEKITEPVEDGVTDTEEYEITISGIITELDYTGLHPSENAIVHLSDECANTNNYLYDTTDQNGEFIFKTGTETFAIGCLDSYRLQVSKRGYVSVKKWFSYSKDQKIQIQLTKVGNYFPLNIGNKWVYEAVGSHGDGSYNWNYSGTEKLEITDQHNDGSLTITCIINGSELVNTATGGDYTININNKKYGLDINFENGKLVLINCDSCSRGNYPVLNNIMLHYSLNFNYPSSTDTIKVDSREGNGDNFHYSLLENVGLVNFKSSYFDGLYIRSISYKLINYDLK